MIGIKCRLIAILILSAIIPLLGFATYNFVQQRRIIKRELFLRHRTAAGNFSLRLDQFMKESETIATTIEYYFIKPDIDAFELGIIINKYVEDFSQLKTIKILTPDRVEFLSAERGPHEPLRDEISTFFISESGRVILTSRIFYDHPGMPSIYFGKRIVRQGQVAYFLVLEVCLSELWLVLDKQIPLNEGNTILVDPGSVILAHSREESKIKAFKREPYLNGNPVSMAGRGIYRYVNGAGEWVAAMSTRIEKFDWYLVHEIFEDSLFTPVRRLTMILLVTLAIVIGMILLFGYALGNILFIRPIRQKERVYIASLFHHALIHDLKKKVFAIRSLIGSRDDQKMKKLGEEARTLDEAFDRFKYFSDEITLNTGRTGLRGFIEGILKKFQTIFSEEGIELQLEGPEDIEIEIDAFYFSRAVENIIYNSIDALKMKEKSRLLKVRITRKSMVISNNGSALLSSELRQVFDPFYTRGKTSGTGLGLAITKNIVNAHRFKIKMENVPGGIATTISFR